MTIKGIKNRIIWFLVNHVYVGTKFFGIKRCLLRKLGMEIGEDTKVVGPVFCSGDLIVGRNCWLGKNLVINGNGKVFIGDNCDIAPEVTFLTGSHKIGKKERRAGEGYNDDIIVKEGSWIGARSTVLSGVAISSGAVVAACSCVVSNIEENSMVGGVPAKEIKKLSND